MNIDKVYEVYIYVRYNNSYDRMIQNYFEKTTLVREKMTKNGPVYIDMVTKEKYLVRSENEAPLREYYINANPGLIPYRKLVDTGGTSHMFKKRILKKYYDTKDTKY